MQRSYRIGCCGLVVVTLATLAACGAPQPPLGAQAALPQAKVEASWVLPAAKSKALLYVSNLHKITIFSYPAGERVGKLDVNADTYGLCSDPKGDVFVDAGYNILEYAHAGTKPIAKVTSEYGYPLQCAFDPTTGDLAVIGTFDSGPENVAVYQNVTGKSTDYEDYGPFYNFADCAYDGSGNLFLTGYSATLAELPKGSSTFANYNLSLESGNAALSALQWDGTYITAQEVVSGQQGALLDRIAITSGAAKVVSRTKLSGHSIRFRWLYSGAAIATEEPHNTVIGFWAYPAGGKPTALLKGYGSGFSAATISVAP